MLYNMFNHQTYPDLWHDSQRTTHTHHRIRLLPHRTQSVPHCPVQRPEAQPHRVAPTPATAAVATAIIGHAHFLDVPGVDSALIGPLLVVEADDEELRLVLGHETPRVHLPADPEQWLTRLGGQWADGRHCRRGASLSAAALLVCFYPLQVASVRHLESKLPGSIELLSANLKGNSGHSSRFS